MSFLNYFSRKIECLYNNIKHVILTTFKTKGFFPLMNAFWKSSLGTRLSFHLLICKREEEEDLYFSSKLLERKLNKVERVSRWKKWQNSSFSLSTQLSEEDSLEEEEYQKCLKNALVVSEVFCLPSDYRKDVPPPSKSLYFVNSKHYPSIHS